MWKILFLENFGLRQFWAWNIFSLEHFGLSFFGLENFGPLTSRHMAKVVEWFYAMLKKQPPWCLLYPFGAPPAWINATLPVSTPLSRRSRVAMVRFVFRASTNRAAPVPPRVRASCHRKKSRSTLGLFRCSHQSQRLFRDWWARPSSLSAHESKGM